MTRQLVEQAKVLCLFNTLGTPTNSAIHKYVNQKKVPHLFVSTGASQWGKLEESVLMQNDDYGKDSFEGFKEGLGKEGGRIVKPVTYKVTDPTVDSQDIQMKGSGINAAMMREILMKKWAIT